MSIYCPHIWHRFTIQGHCEECRPDLHYVSSVLMARHARLEDEFFKQTGKKALDAWYEFEAFVDRTVSNQSEGVQ